MSSARRQALRQRVVVRQSEASEKDHDRLLQALVVHPTHTSPQKDPHPLPESPPQTHRRTTRLTHCRKGYTPESSPQVVHPRKFSTRGSPQNVFHVVHLRKFSVRRSPQSFAQVVHTRKLSIRGSPQRVFYKWYTSESSPLGVHPRVFHKWYTPESSP